MKYESTYSNVQPNSPPQLNLVVNVDKHQKKVTVEKPKTKPPAKSENIPYVTKPHCPCNQPKSPLSKRLVAERDTDPIQHLDQPNKEKIVKLKNVNDKRPSSGVQFENKENVNKDNETKRPPQRKSTGVKESKKLIRNTPTDLFQKYQEDWIKYKHLLPGENSREDVREVVRKKLQKSDANQKVYPFFSLK